MVTDDAATIHVRWMIAKDMQEVQAINNASLQFPWSERDFEITIRHRDITGIVSTIDNRVVGYAVYELFKTAIDILNLAVDPTMRRQGVGSALVDKIQCILSRGRRNLIGVCVSEEKTAGQLFLKSRGFFWDLTIPEAYGDGSEDAYHFSYKLPADCARHLDMHVPADFSIPVV